MTSYWKHIEVEDVVQLKGSYPSLDDIARETVSASQKLLGRIIVVVTISWGVLLTCDKSYTPKDTQAQIQDLQLNSLSAIQPVRMPARAQPELEAESQCALTPQTLELRSCS